MCLCQLLRAFEFPFVDGAGVTRRNAFHVLCQLLLVAQGYTRGFLLRRADYQEIQVYNRIIHMVSKSMDTIALNSHEVLVTVFGTLTFKQRAGITHQMLGSLVEFIVPDRSVLTLYTVQVYTHDGRFVMACPDGVVLRSLLRTLTDNVIPLVIR